MDGWLVAVSAATGLSGYIFNAVVARSLGAVYLGHMMACFGVALVAATPAALLVLPLARWAAAAPAWRTAWLRWEGAALGAGVLMGGALFKLGFVLLIARIAPRGWWLPLGLYLAAQAPGAFHAAMLTGRRRYRSVSWVTLVGGIGKLGVRPGIVGGDALRCGREEPTEERPGVPARLRAGTGPQEAPAAAP